MTFNIKEICEYDKSLAVEILNLIKKEHWDLDNIRQKVFKVHEQTKTIKLRHVKDLNFNDTNFINYPLFDEYKGSIEKILKIISNYYKIYDYCCILTKLDANGKIDSHVDIGSVYFEKSHRLHIPIKTNENVIFFVKNNSKNMEVGKIYEINNTNVHGVINNSYEDRIHLIIDIFEKKLNEINYKYF